MNPNILILCTHDSGRFFGCYGVETVSSTNIDRLASEGVLLDQFTAASPICSPSRGAMMTGTWPQENGLLGLTHHGFRFKTGVRHAADLFRKANYETTLFHFQHVAERQDWSALGYEQYLSPSRDEEFLRYPDMAIPAPVLGHDVAKWLRGRESDRPFFAHVNFNETHTPFDFGGVDPDRCRGVTVPPWIRHDTEAEKHFSMLQGAVSSLDKGVGQIMEALDQAGLRDNTLVVFTTDHGLEGARDKWTVYESGIGIAGVVRFPAAGIGGGRRVATPLSNVDLLPTLLELAGLKVPEYLSGESFAPLLSGQPGGTKNRPVFSIYHNGGSRSVRVGDWKLIRNLLAEPYQEAAPVTLGGTGIRHPRLPAELYFLADDPSETNNLAERHPNRVRELSSLLGEWMRATGDPAFIGGYVNLS